MGNDVIIKNAILHILDNVSGVPVFSNIELEMNDDIDGFINKHIQKVLNDGNLQEAEFGIDSNVRGFLGELAQGKMNFVEVSINMADELFEIMRRHVDIPPADLLVALFGIGEVEYLGIFKMNYKEGYSHYVVQGESGVSNTIIKQKALLPLETQKVDECAVVDLIDFRIKLMQKQYEINGEKSEYWSSMYLKCRSRLSNNSKLKVLDKAVKNITKKYFEEDFSKAAQLKKVVAESLQTSAEIEIEEIAKQVFPKDETIKKEYVEEVRKAGLQEKKFELPETQISKRVVNHKIKTDNGIEINFPAKYFDDTQYLEFFNNPDGTISILIKNVMRIENR